MIKLVVRRGLRLFSAVFRVGSSRIPACYPGLGQKMAKADDIVRRYHTTLQVLAK